VSFLYTLLNKVVCPLKLTRWHGEVVTNMNYMIGLEHEKLLFLFNRYQQQLSMFF